MRVGEGQQFVNRIGGDCNERFVTRGCLSMSEFEKSSIGHELARSSPSRDLIVVAGSRRPNQRRSRDLRPLTGFSCLDSQ